MSKPPNNATRKPAKGTPLAFFAVVLAVVVLILAYILFNAVRQTRPGAGSHPGASIQHTSAAVQA